MIISQGFVINLFLFATIGIFAIALFSTFMIISLVKECVKLKIKKLQFENSLCPSCRKKMVDYKIQKLKD